MLGKTILGAGAIFLAVYAFMPRSDADQPMFVPKPGATALADDFGDYDGGGFGFANSMNDSGWGTAIDRAGDGHFYADAYVNDVSTRFMVDTGASTIALTGDDADAIGLDWSPDQVMPVARGASGTVYGVRVTLDHVELGGFEARGLTAIIVAEGLDISLLGQSFLGTIDSVQIKGDQMVFER